MGDYKYSSKGFFCCWCQGGIKGKKSWDIGLCSKCRKSKQGKEYLNKLKTTIK